jgi:hypothetical protein
MYKTVARCLSASGVTSSQLIGRLDVKSFLNNHGAQLTASERTKFETFQNNQQKLKARENELARVLLRSDVSN